MGTRGKKNREKKIGEGGTRRDEGAIVAKPTHPWLKDQEQ